MPPPLGYTRDRAMLQSQGEFRGLYKQHSQAPKYFRVVQEGEVQDHFRTSQKVSRNEGPREVSRIVNGKGVDFYVDDSVKVGCA